MEWQSSRASAAFNQLIARSMDPQPPLRDIGQHLRTSLVFRFLRGVAPDGTPWKPSKRAASQSGGKGKTLVDRGHLRDSFNAYLQSNLLRFGSNLVYAAAHHFGVNKTVVVGEHNRTVTHAFGQTIAPVTASVKSHSRKMFLPVRRLIGWTEDDDRYAAQAFNAYLAGGLS